MTDHPICIMCKQPMTVKESYTHNTWAVCPFCGIAQVEKSSEFKEDLKAAVESLMAPVPKHHRQPSLN